jgi:hypothetical protein
MDRAAAHRSSSRPFMCVVMFAFMFAPASERSEGRTQHRVAAFAKSGTG